MATYGTDTSPDSRSRSRSRHSSRAEPSTEVISERYQILDGLPQNHVLRTYTSLEAVENAVKSIHDHLQQAGWQGNQWLVLLGLSQSAITKLSSDPNTLAGIKYRFSWQGGTGLIKVVPSAAHVVTTDAFLSIAFARATMGVPRHDICWGGSPTTPGTVTTHGKEPDQCFYPPSRQPRLGQLNGWPSLVIETGVSDSQAKLRRDATWWFQNSSGETRIVLLISIRVAAREARIEKWQLVSPSFPRPATRQVINQLRQQPGQMPPMAQQPASTQQAFWVQEVVVTPTSVTGAPMVIPFVALFDRQPVGNEGDITIDAQEFRYITRRL